MSNEAIYGDQSDFAKNLVKAPDQFWNGDLEGDVSDLSAAKETGLRWQSFKKFSESIDGEDPSKIQDLFNSAASGFAEAWNSKSNSKSPFSQKLTNFDKEFPSENPFLIGFYNWLFEIKSIDRSHQIVLDLALHYLDLKDNGPGSESENKEIADWLKNQFPDRIRSIQEYRNWVIEGYVYDYCGQLNNSVCTPILLAEIGSEWKPSGDRVRTGQVMWLTIDLFRDGMVGLVPDVLSLGWTEIVGQSTNEDEDSNGILQSFDRMWELSGLSEFGFSGRWRITNKPTVSTSASLFEGPTRYNNYLGGKSADCAILVALLAAAGAVYEPLTNEWNPDESKRVFLNPKIVVTATVGQEQAPNDDVRNCRIGKVREVDAKTQAAEDYGTTKPYVDTVIYSILEQEDKNDAFADRIKESEVRKSSRSTQVAPGLFLESAETVQDVLNWILSVNQWKKAWNQFHVEEWESKWGWLKDADGVFLMKDLKPIINEKTKKPLSEDDPNFDELINKFGVNTGSLEYMQNPIGGATDSSQLDVEDSGTEDEQIIPSD